MAHFAQLDDNNVVTQVIVVSNNELLVDGVENENKGISFCKSLYGDDTKWIQTSYNSTIRKNYAGIGFTYNADLDAFIAPQPFVSWILNEETCKWEAPIPQPDSETSVWNEELQQWEKPNE